MKKMKSIYRGQGGQDMVEYGLLAAFISIVSIGALLQFGPSLKPAYYKLQDAVRRAATASYPGSTGDDAGGKGDTTPTD
jgi:Flp pilus assembly pilin Flp